MKRKRINFLYFVVHNEEFKEKAHGLENVGIAAHPSALKGGGENTGGCEGKVAGQRGLPQPGENCDSKLVNSLKLTCSK